MQLPREFYEPFANPLPGMVGNEDCESLFAHLRGKGAAAEKNLARRCFGIQQSLASNELAMSLVSSGARSRGIQLPDSLN